MKRSSLNSWRSVPMQAEVWCHVGHWRWYCRQSWWCRLALLNANWRWAWLLEVSGFSDLCFAGTWGSQHFPRTRIWLRRGLHYGIVGWCTWNTSWQRSLGVAGSCGCHPIRWMCFRTAGDYGAVLQNKRARVPRTEASDAPTQLIRWGSSTSRPMPCRLLFISPTSFSSSSSRTVVRHFMLIVFLFFDVIFAVTFYMWHPYKMKYNSKVCCIYDC